MKKRNKKNIQLTLFCFVFLVCKNKELHYKTNGNLFESISTISEDSVFQLKRLPYQYKEMSIFSYFDYSNKPFNIGALTSPYLVTDKNTVYALLIDKKCENCYEKSDYTISVGFEDTLKSKNLECDITIYPIINVSIAIADTFHIFKTGIWITLENLLWDTTQQDSIYSFIFHKQNKEEETIITMGKKSGIKGLAIRHLVKDVFYISHVLGQPFYKNDILKKNYRLILEEKFNPYMIPKVPDVNLAKIQALKRIQL